MYIAYMIIDLNRAIVRTFFIVHQIWSIRVDAIVAEHLTEAVI